MIQNSIGKKKSFFEQEIKKVQKSNELRLNYTKALNETVEAECICNTLLEYFYPKQSVFEKKIKKLENERADAIKGIEEKFNAFPEIGDDPKLKAAWEKEFLAPSIEKMTAFEDLRYEMKILDIQQNRTLFQGLVLVLFEALREKVLDLDQTQFDKDKALQAIFGLLSSASPVGNLVAMVDNIINLGKSILAGKQKLYTHAADQTLSYLEDYTLIVTVWNAMGTQIEKQIASYATSI